MHTGLLTRSPARTRSIVMVLLASTLLAGCAATGTSGKGAAAGGALGAAAGGAIGAAAGGRDGAIAGAIIGGVFGAIIGDAIERAEIDRQRQLALKSGRSSSRVIKNESNANVRIRTDVRTVPKADGSGLSCREATTFKDGQQVGSTGRACQVRQGDGRLSWEI
jgi:hypothetical protein